MLMTGNQKSVHAIRRQWSEEVILVSTELRLTKGTARHQLLGRSRDWYFAATLAVVDKLESEEEASRQKDWFSS